MSAGANRFWKLDLREHSTFLHGVLADKKGGLYGELTAEIQGMYPCPPGPGMSPYALHLW